MNNSLRLLIGIFGGAAVLLLALYVVPSIGFISTFVQTTPVGSGEITQLTLLIVSLVLSYYLSGRKLSLYGFRGVGPKKLLGPILISIIAVVLFFIVMNIQMVLLGLDPDKMGESGLDKSALNFLLTVIIFASTCEEIFYRGLIYSFLSPLNKSGFRFFKVFISLPVTVCALMFGLGHLCLLGSMHNAVVTGIVVAATLLGFIAGYYREKTGSLLPAIASHMTFNMVAFGIPTIMSSLAE